MKRGGKFNPERAATVLVEAALRGDERAARKHGVTVRTLTNWRTRLEYDDKFSAIFLSKLKAATDGWAERLSEVIVAALSFVHEAVQRADPRDVGSVGAISGTLRTLLEAKFALDMLHARVAGKGSSLSADAGALVAAGDTRADDNGSADAASKPTSGSGRSEAV